MAEQLSEAREHVKSAANRLGGVLAERDLLRAAIAWALGEEGDFTLAEEGQGPFWWRTELRRRAAVDAFDKEDTR